MLAAIAYAVTVTMMNEASPHIRPAADRAAHSTDRGRQPARSACSWSISARRMPPTRFGSAPLSQGVSQRSAGDREPGPAVEAGPQRLHPAHQAAAKGARLPQDLESRRRTNRRSRPSRARRPRSLLPTLEPSGAHIVVDWAMRYGNPSIASRHARSSPDRGCERHSGYPALSAILRGDDRQPSATRCFAPSRACASSRRCASRRPITMTRSISRRSHPRPAAELSQLDFAPDIILASFHGVPQDYVDKGDPYYAHCLQTVRLLREQLELDESKLMMTFQSRFGRAQWLEPATDRHRRRAGQERGEESRGDHARLLGRLPGNAGGDRGRECAALQAARRRNFAAIPCLNDSAPGHAGDLADGRARARRLDLKRSGVVEAHGGALQQPKTCALRRASASSTLRGVSVLRLNRLPRRSEAALAGRGSGGEEGTRHAVRLRCLRDRLRGARDPRSCSPGSRPCRRAIIGPSSGSVSTPAPCSRA